MTDASIESRVPPHDAEAEAAVLSAVMNDVGCMAKAAAALKPEQMYSEAHRRIFEACCAIWSEGTRPDAVTVLSRLKDTGRLAQVGGASYLTTVLNAAPGLGNIDRYLSIVIQKHQLRQMILACQQITAQAYAGVVDVPAFIDHAEQAVYEIARTNAIRPKLHPIRGVLQDEVVAWQKAEDMARATGKAAMRGVPTGIERYDRVTGGLHDGELTIIAARPGMAKTSLVLHWAMNVASLTSEVDGVTACRDVAAMFSLEMPQNQIAGRIVCAEARVDVSKPRTGFLTPKDWHQIVSSVGSTIAKAEFYIDDTPGLTLMQVRSMCRELVSELARETDPKKRKRLRLVVVDYLQLMDGDGDERSREEVVSRISRGLKRLAKEMGLPVVALAQLNRSVEARTDKRPMLSDIRESGSVEQDADTVCFIYRDEYYEADSKDRGGAELIIGKQRNGPTGTVKARFDAQYTRFENLADGQYEEYEHG